MDSSVAPRPMLGAASTVWTLKSPCVSLLAWVPHRAVLRFFYDTQLRWISSGSAVHPHPVRATRGLLQGCPASPCLLNATMTLWVLTVQRSAPDVRLAVYLDDRSIWQLDTSDLGPLLAATRAGQEVDAATGMTLHPGKLGCFALAPSLRRALALNADVFGPVTTMPSLLGITYMIGGRTLCAPASQVSHPVAHRCRKIARAGRTLRLRRCLLTLLVVSLFRWTGPWHRYAVADLDKWTGADTFLDNTQLCSCGSNLCNTLRTMPANDL